MAQPRIYFDGVTVLRVLTPIGYAVIAYRDGAKSVYLPAVYNLQISEFLRTTVLIDTEKRNGTTVRIGGPIAAWVTPANNINPPMMYQMDKTMLNALCSYLQQDSDGEEALEAVNAAVKLLPAQAILDVARQAMPL